jgi:hypothetical protein
MTRRGKLEDVAAGILGSFVSRNNDVGGYWGLGLLRSLADRQRTSTLRLDLLGQGVEPSDRLIAAIAAKYREALQRQLARRGIAKDVVTEAEIQIDFNAEASIFSSLPTYGEPTRCSIRLLDDRGREYRRSLRTACSPHDPRRESRRRRESPS